MSRPPILIALVSLAVSGCAGIAARGARPAPVADLLAHDSFLVADAAPPPPAAIVGAGRVSPLRPAAGLGGGFADELCASEPGSVPDGFGSVPDGFAPGSAPDCAPCGGVERSPWYVGGAFTWIPNVGPAVEVGRTFAHDRLGAWSAEAQLAYQPWDDKDFIDDDNPHAGDVVQVRAGVKLSSAPWHFRHVVGRAGAVWFSAEGEPNIVNDAGDYFGGYVSVGLETDVSDALTVGPEIGVMVVPGEGRGSKDGVFVVPQFQWRVDVAVPHCGGLFRGWREGELYAGLSASVFPGVGGGLFVGQRISRSCTVEWSTELWAVFHSISDDLGFEDTEAESKFALIRGLAKATLSPDSCRHVVLRGGLCWFRVTGDPVGGDLNVLNGDTGDFWGLSLGAGYEWDLSSRVSTGPEASMAVGFQEGSSDVVVVPQLAWNVVFRL